MVAPNSPNALAQVITLPLKIEVQDKGNVIYLKVCQRVAPSRADACFSSVSTEEKPIVAALIYRGEATNVCAIITAITVKGIVISMEDKKAPNNPLRPNAISRAMPATEGGKTVGRSMMVSIRRCNRKLRCDNSRATGVPKSSVIAVVDNDVKTLKFIACNNWVLLIVSNNLLTGTFKKIAIIGMVMNKTSGIARERHEFLIPLRIQEGTPRWKSGFSIVVSGMRSEFVAIGADLSIEPDHFNKPEIS
jgi:hypothetical protein